MRWDLQRVVAAVLLPLPGSLTAPDRTHGLPGGLRSYAAPRLLCRS